jgi:hypothetical protein
MSPAGMFSGSMKWLLMCGVVCAVALSGSRTGKADCANYAFAQGFACCCESFVATKDTHCVAGQDAQTGHYESRSACPGCGCSYSYETWIYDPASCDCNGGGDGDPGDGGGGGGGGCGNGSGC